MTKGLTLANHQRIDSYWDGGHYELNLSFDTLRDKQWQRVLQAVWEHPAILGPLATRYSPGLDLPETVGVQVPPPTATLTQYGQLKADEAVIGFDLQATRSLFECVSVLVPVGMFNLSQGVGSGELKTLDTVLYDIALRVYDAASFKIAAVGYERGCQLAMELLGSAEQSSVFLAAGNALVQDDVLRMLNLNVADYEQVRANLRWLAPKS